MSDETKIEQALSAEQWAKEDVGLVWIDRDGPAACLGIAGDWDSIPAEALPAAIALANAALPDNDPRKITRRLVDAIRIATEQANTPSHYEALHAIADALASYLPPETPSDQTPGGVYFRPVDPE